MIYTVLLIIIAVIAYGCGSMSSVVIASNFVFHVNLRRLGTGSSALSNFRRIYGAKGFVKLLLVELVRDILPILIGGLLMGIKGQVAVGRAFAGFCLVMGRLYPVFYDLKGSHAIICMLVVMAFVNFSGALAVLLFVVLGIWLTKNVSLGAVHRVASAGGRSAGDEACALCGACGARAAYTRRVAHALRPRDKAQLRGRYQL